MVDPFTKEGVLRLLELAADEAGLPEGYAIADDAVTYCINLLTMMKAKYNALTGTDDEKFEQFDVFQAYAAYHNFGPSVKTIADAEAKLQAAFRYILLDLLEDTVTTAYERDEERVTCFLINLTLSEGESKAFAGLIPPPPLCAHRKDSDYPGYEEQLRLGPTSRRFLWTHVDTATITNYLDRAFPERLMDLDVVIVCRYVVEHIYLIFMSVPDERCNAWLDSIPTEKLPEVTSLSERIFNKVMQLIVIGLKQWLQPSDTITYNHLVYAVMQNPVYDLTPYLRVMHVE
ncbi:Hypothetical protein POVN_LOCUS490 [uncultured virus]|nr:Hypothetical protein POVN_LOCUS490 [uncultured virus]